jgi:hypothetical protein
MNGKNGGGLSDFAICIPTLEGAIFGNHFWKQMVGFYSTTYCLNKEYSMNSCTKNRRHPWHARIARTLLAAALVLPGSVFALAPVNLGSTASFAIVAASNVSNVPHSAVTGNIGLSPGTGAGITGFGPTEVQGTIYTVDASYPIPNVAVINPAGLTQVKGDLTNAYNDAAGRQPAPTGNYLNPGAGNLGGLKLGPGLYRFTGAAQVSGSDLTLNGTANDVWIFQISAGLSVAGGMRVMLEGGAQAANVFWQVGSSATLGVNSVMQGTILADQSITLATHATLNGRALARIGNVTLQMNTITRP